MNIEEVLISTLIPDPANARKHSAKNIAAIKGSLSRFGQQKPIVVSKSNVVIAGNGTLQAAMELNWDKINVVRSSLKGSDVTAFGIADNRTAELAEWDQDVLGGLLQSLREEDFDLGDLGFDIGDLEDYLAPDEKGLTDPDDIPEIPQNVRNVQRGQIWILGEHRMMCGDSTSKDDVERLMGGEKADMVFTDPPYGISYTNTQSHGSLSRNLNKFEIIKGDESEFDPSFILEYFNYCDEIFVWGIQNYPANFPKSTWICWDRKLAETADKNLTGDFDLCWSKKKHKMCMVRIVWHGVCGHNKTDDGERRFHPTMKPVKLAEFFFEKWGKNRSNVVDLFLGSGSTLIACEKTNRKCYGMEIDPHYCSVILERWEKFSGKKASLFKND